MATSLPFFSIVVPTYDRPAALRACLGALAQMRYPRDRFEVIVVDDGSPTSLESVVAPFRDRLDVTLHRQANAGPAAARNTGAQQARGPLLAFTDDDCRPAPGWLRALAAQFEQAPQALVGGRTVNALPDNPFSTASQLLIHYLYGYYNRRSGQARFFASNNIAVPAQRFQELGGFDTTFPLAAGEDRELCDCWRHHDYPMRYAPEATVRHAHPMTLRSFWRQHFNYGRGASHFYEARSRRGQLFLTPEPLSFYSGLLRYPLSRRSGASGARLCVLMGISQVANAAGFFWERLRSRLAPGE